MNTSQLLPLTLFIPLLGAVLIALAGRWPNLRETVTLVTAGALFTTVLAIGANTGAQPGQHTVLLEMLPGLSLSLHTEPLSLLFALIASGLWIVTSVYAIGYMRGNKEQQQTRFYVCFALALTGAMGIAFAANLFTLFIFYEVLTLSTYPLVAHKGDEKARNGARTYLSILLFTSIGLLLPALIWVYSATGTLEFTPGGIIGDQLSPLAGSILLIMFVLGVGKAAVMPVHRWLPAAMVAPTPVSALLHAVAVVKAGVFTLLKVIIYLFGIDFLASVPAQQWLVYLAGFTVVAASVIALYQTNLKRMLAYSTIGQLSYIVMAGLLLSPMAVTGAMLHIAVHAFAKITLFFTAGAIYVASKKTEITQLDGIGRRMPVTMVAFTIGALSMIGVPPTGGFISKWFMLGGAFQANDYIVVLVLLLSTGLNAAYFLPIVIRAFFRQEQDPPAKDHGEAPWPMVLALGCTATLTLLVFVFHAPLLALVQLIGGGTP